MIRGSALLIFLVGCFRPSYDRPACGPGGACPDGLTCNADSICDVGVSDGRIGSNPNDAADDTAVDDASRCFGRGLVRICFDVLPTNVVNLVGATIDTGVDASCTQVSTQVGGPALCVIAGTSVFVSGPVTAIGTRPLVVIGLDMVTIGGGGSLDVSSRTGSRRGAGANTGTCTTIPPAETDAGGGGGGGGGGFGSAGSNGGEGDRNQSTRPDGAAIGGPAGLSQVAVALRGGCPGGMGGDSDAQHRGGSGGDGGGAVYVIAGRALTLSGNVFASGAGGRATPDATGIEQGGGGGGAGGMIGLDAPAIVITGRVVANGGAGAGGGGLTIGGSSGGDGTTVAWDQRATGGTPAPDSNGPGAAGSAITAPIPAAPPDSDGGGGGGGGGVGVIRIDGTMSGGAMISPSPSIH